MDGNGESRHVEQGRAMEEARLWLSALETQDTQLNAQFADWITRSHCNVREFLFITAVQEEIRNGEWQRHIKPATQTAAARENVISLRPLPTRTLTTAPSVQDTGSFRRKWLALAAGVVVALALGWGATQELTPHKTYLTAIGQQRAVRLADGSLIQLNTHSRIDVRYNWRTRDIRLVEGEAQFTVARDAMRPFRVAAGSVSVEALGTQFTVQRYATERTRVLVTEGRIMINMDDRDQRAKLLLAAGQIAEIRRQGSGRALTVHTVSLTESARQLSWLQGRIRFSGQTLAEAASEFNRYNSTQIVITDPAIGNKRISGIFPATEADAFASTLQAEPFQLRVERFNPPGSGRMFIRLERRLSP